MRVRALLVCLLTLSAALPAAAQLRPELRHRDEEPGEGTDWDAEVRLQLSGEYDLTRPRAPDGPLLRDGSVAPRVVGAYFLHPLLDERMQPLALLEFFQHPGRLQVGLTQQTDLDRVDTRWRTAKRSLGVDVSAVGYPWEQTGVRGVFGTNYSGISAASHDALALAYEAGLLHYFRPTLRGELSYVGAVSQSSRVVSGANAALQDLDEATNAGRLAAEGILLQDRLGVRVQLDLGQYTQDRTTTALAGAALPGEFTHGLLFSALATVSGYFGRDFSAALQGGLRGRSGETRPDTGTTGAISRTTLTPVLAPSLSYFIFDDLFATAGYTLAFPHVDATGAPSSVGVQHLVTGALALRL